MAAKVWSIANSGFIAPVITQFKKGNILSVEGKIRTDKYVDAEGVEKQLRKIRVTSFQMMNSMLGNRDENADRGAVDPFDMSDKSDNDNDNHLS